MEEQLSTPQANELFEALPLLQTPDECRAFFRDLCSLAELQAMVERFQDAKLINEGVSYREVAKQTGSSTATVTRVAHWLHHGMGGYTLLLKRINKL